MRARGINPASTGLRGYDPAANRQIHNRPAPEGFLPDDTGAAVHDYADMETSFAHPESFDADSGDTDAD